MSSSPPAQFLEWTFKDRFWYKHLIGDVLFEWRVILCVLIGILFFYGVMTGKFTAEHTTHEINWSHGLGRFMILIALITIATLCYMSSPYYRLRIDRQKITFTRSLLWDRKVRWIPVAGAKFSAVYFNRYNRVYTLDFNRVYAYYIEICQGGETFRFPCNDAQEQSQILKKINEFLAQ
jgi:NADH:ubiquinone oxidoreductase subunit 5 (subunit L)/multisubunit Na+/H+ antiporter MnhA subunit